MIDRLIKADPLADAGITAATTLTYYALPDFVRSKLLRYLGKSVLLGLSTGQAIVTANATLPEDRENIRRLLDRADKDTIRKTAGIVAAAGLATTVAAIAGEKYIFNRGERAREAGARLPHTKQGLVLAALAGGLVYAIEKAEQD